MLWQLDRMAGVADFVSVGTNDLYQFMTASDRGNMLVASRFDPLSRPFLRALRTIVEICGRTMPVTICGELAADPLAAMAIVGLGYRSLSIAPAAIGPVKAMVLALDAGKVTRMVGDLLDGDSTDDNMRAALLAFAERERVPH
jgi:phosphotransferase system enzyme I (PtsP)